MEMAPLSLISHLGKIVDMGIKDANNMGAAMAPAALDTLLTHFSDTGRAPSYYDAIITGDLGLIGKDILIDLAGKSGFNIKSVYNDIISIINGQNCSRYSTEQIFTNNENVPMDEETINKNARNLIIAKNKIIEKEKENEDILMKNGGKINYNANLFFKKDFKKNDYYKNFYINMK